MSPFITFHKSIRLSDAAQTKLYAYIERLRTRTGIPWALHHVYDEAMPKAFLVADMDREMRLRYKAKENKWVKQDKSGRG